MTINMPINAEAALSQINQTIYMLKKAKRALIIGETKIADLVEDPVVEFPECYTNDLILAEEKITAGLNRMQAIHEILVRHLLSKATWEVVPPEEEDDDD